MKIGAFGEVMLRLTPPEHYLLEQTHTLRMDYTGTGVNILGNLAHFGLETFLMTNLPANRLGDAAKANLRFLGINPAFIGQKYQHLGSYFAEVGYGQRPTQVTYQNRHGSSFGLSKVSDYPLDKFLDAVDMVHICGISLSLTEETWKTAYTLAQKAFEQKKKVCFDFNFRPSLNTEKGKRELMKKRYAAILPFCDIVFGSSRDLIELLSMLKESDTEASETQLIQQFMKNYDIEWFSGTKRWHKEGKLLLSATLYTKEQTAAAASQPLQVLDRIGTGDAFAAGVMLGYTEKWSLQKTVDFSLTNAVLAHTISGDVPLTSRTQVEQAIADPTIDLIR